MSIEVSHLVVNGCSFTYCQGIEDPHLNGWPALLAKKLGVPVVNLAIGGSGNDSIQRRTYEYFYKSQKHYPNSKPLYITAFSGANRREEFFKKYNGHILPGYRTLDLQAGSIDLVATLSNPEDIHKVVEYSHIMNLNFEACERKKFLCWNSIINLCKAHDIPYLTGDYYPTSNEDIKNYMLEYYSELYLNALDDSNTVGNIPEKTTDIEKLPFEKLPCGHESVQAMPIVCDLFYNKFMKVYKNVIPIKEDFLTLKTFYHFESQKHFPHNEWLTNSD